MLICSPIANMFCFARDALVCRLDRVYDFGIEREFRGQKRQRRPNVRL